MYQRTKKLLGILFLIATLVLTSTNLAVASPQGPKHATYEVTITNLTGADQNFDYGQPLTPPLIATHRGGTSFFEIGQPASEGIQEIAENGNLDPMLAALENNKHISHVVVAVADDPPPLEPGESVTINIDAKPGANFLSFASMLICTNDGFTGVSRLKLPKQIGDSVTAETAGYDAGTEINTEKFDDIVPPCSGLSGVEYNGPGATTSNPALAENSVIMHHGGIVGDNDLDSDIHGWNDPVTKIEITRVN